MRLSTAADRDDAASVALLHAAFDAGVDLLDTADAYCLEASEAGHNERLIARALASWQGDRSRIVVATKGGLTRPEGRWLADGRARHLAAACEASRRALGVDRIALYQLHAPDPKTPLATSVRALAALRRDGLVERIGLCNVGLKELEEALRHAEIDSVQVELSVLHDDSLWNGVAARCVAERIPLLAYRPLGGYDKRAKLARDPVLGAIAARHGATPFEVALAWLRDLSPLVLPIPGATRLESLASLVRSAALVLDDADREQLAERVPAARQLRGERPSAPATRAESGEVVLLMGLPAAGKSTLAARFVEGGYARLNRDEQGGRLADLVPELERAIAAGSRRFVLDNTYATRKVRAPIVATAARHGLRARCVWLETKVEDAQVNAVSRMLRRYGRLLGPAEMQAASKSDPGAFPPGVLFRYERAFEPPDAAEGFSAIETVPFQREKDPSFTNRAVVVWLDGVLWRSRSEARAPRSPDDLDLLPGAIDSLRGRAEEGFLLFGLTWRPDLGRPDGISREALESCFDALRAALRLPFPISYCSHAAGPPVCWCRKPLPGLGVELVLKHELHAARSVYVGRSRLDQTFAERVGFSFRDASEALGPAAP